MSKVLYAAWPESAFTDLKNMQYLLQDEFMTHIVAFHAQQRVEKSLKAILEFKNAKVPRDHSTIRLFALVKPCCEEVLSEDILTDLDALYIDACYPGDMGLLPQGNPDLEDAAEFYLYAQSVFVAACNVTGIEWETV